MKIRYSKTILTLFLACFATAVLADENGTQATIRNDSKAYKQFKLTYRTFHQNPGQARVLGPTQTTFIRDSITVPLKLNGFEQAGIEVVAINKHVLPDDISHLCSLTTSKQKWKGELLLEYSSVGKQHELSCSTDKGS